MKILLVSASSIRFTVETPLHEPLGGSESCVAYLLPTLAALGHDVTLMAELPQGTLAGGASVQIAGVRHVDIAAADDRDFFAQSDFDVVIAVSCPAVAGFLREMAPRAVHIAWLKQLTDQPAMAHLEKMAPEIDCAVFNTAYQRGVTPFVGRTQVIGNGIAPAFENLFASADALLAAKRNRAVYTSTPFRGLNLLVEVMRRAEVKTAFDVYSGMRLYQQDEGRFAELYTQLEATPRCRRHEPVGQAELAGALRSAAFLTYPCSFAETYCNAALEAMAAGLKVIATDFGCLSETTLGYADLMPLSAGMAWADIVPEFTRRLERQVQVFQTEPLAWAEAQFDQVLSVNHSCTWRARAGEWDRFLQGLLAERAAAPPLHRRA